MEVIEKFSKELEHEIFKLNNAFAIYKEKMSINKYANLFEKENMSQLDLNTCKIIIKTIGKFLTSEEQEFLLEFVSLPDFAKDTKINVIGFKEDELNYLEHIKNIVSKDISDTEEYQNFDSRLNQLKNLQNKINKNTIDFIIEIDLIVDIAKKHNFTTEEIMFLLEEVNLINSNNYEKYKINLEDNYEEEIKSEDSLVITNIDPETVYDLLKEYGINFEHSYQSMNSLEKLVIEKLSKYGELEKMKGTLSALKKKQLIKYLSAQNYSSALILYKTLLFSDECMLDKVYEICEENKIDLQQLIRKKPTILFPANTERKKTGRKLEEFSNMRAYTYGDLNNFINGVDFLNKNGFSSAKVASKCPTFFTGSINIKNRTLKGLKLYNFDMSDKEYGFSIFQTANVLDRLDMAIESDCIDYVSINVSRVKEGFNLYYIKYLQSIGERLSDIFKTTEGKGMMFCQSSYPPISEEETFEKYEAVTPDIEDIELFDEIITNNSNDIITDLAEYDSLIMQLDDLYKENILMYRFGNTIISRKKVLRLYQTLISKPNIYPSKNVLFYAITKNSMLNQHELNDIARVLEEIEIKEL